MRFFEQPSIYFIMGTENTGGRDPLAVLEQALDGGIHIFQLREKGSSALRGEELKSFAWNCKNLCGRYGVPFLINDDIELACEIEADGIHIGQEDAEASSVRKRVGQNRILGVSVHSVEEARMAVHSGADYLGMGPVFGTRSKADAKEPAGVIGIQSVRARYPDLPIIGIGGITPENAGKVWSAGANGVAVISAIAQSDDVVRQVERFQASLRAGGME
ncbi:MAG TPA: thiamine phosphate synthase [Planococcus sp. (in: firmicutes)]|nr:thiamine phosphate synthase [Planococcus sp. (in: firmicutes)]